MPKKRLNIKHYANLTAALYRCIVMAVSQNQPFILNCSSLLTISLNFYVTVPHTMTSICITFFYFFPGGDVLDLAVPPTGEETQEHHGADDQEAQVRVNGHQREPTSRHTYNSINAFERCA